MKLKKIRVSNNEMQRIRPFTLHNKQTEAPLRSDPNFANTQVLKTRKTSQFVERWVQLKMKKLQ